MDTKKVTGSEMDIKKVAVIGIGCRLPGGINSPNDFWRGLVEGIDAITEVPSDRWSTKYFYDPDTEKAGKIKNSKGGFIKNVDKFDAEYFDIFPAEASRMDPQQRILLEVTHECVEDAGIPLNVFKGSRTSVFVGAFMYDYQCMQTSTDMRDTINSYAAMGTDVAAISNRISYVYDLKGPSVTLDTACSSSLVALHYAYKSIINGEADMAIAAGVNAILRPESSITLSKGGFLSPDGYCKSFDESANGYVRSEGAGVVILKPLGRAIEDGDQIYGIIVSSAVNQDGFVQEGFTVPSADAQIELLQTAYSSIDPATISYIEAHGTGTVVGDPIEIHALGTVIGQAINRTNNLIVGSVKSNLGHLEGASGITGFIKSILVLNKKCIPANIHINKLNPKIDFDTLRIKIPTELISINSSVDIMRTGVNSFGAGGTNAHIVLEEYKKPARIFVDKNSRSLRPKPFVFYGKTIEALSNIAKRYIQYLDDSSIDINDVGYSLLTRRSRLSNNLCISAKNKEELIECLGEFLNNEKSSRFCTQQIEVDKKTKVAFVFSGQGGQWAQMGMELYESNELFRASMDQIDALFKKYSGWSILDEIKKDSNSSNIDRTDIVQPAIMCVQIALAKLLMYYGITPEGIVGHSIGEVAAAHISGAITLEDAVQVIYHRSTLQNKMAGRGRMLAVGVSEDVARELISLFPGKVSIAAINGPKMITLSGDEQELNAIVSMMDKDGIFNRFVRVEVAYHSHHMEPIQDELVKTLSEVQGAEASIELYSTVDGERKSGEHITGEYWYKNVRQPVLMTKALKAMSENGFDYFIEIGPHPVLVSGANELFSENGINAKAIACMRKGEPEYDVLNTCIGSLIAHGLQIAPNLLYGENCQYQKLPLYPWTQQHYWVETVYARRRREGIVLHPFITKNMSLVTDNSAHIFETKISPNNFPFLQDHQVDTEIVFPATGYLELANACGNILYRESEIYIENITFDSALIFNEKDKSEKDIWLEVTTNEGDYSICSRDSDNESSNEWRKHSSGRINFMRETFPMDNIDIKARCLKLQKQEKSNVDAFYNALSISGLSYGQHFQCIQDIWCQDNEVLARVVLPDNLVYENSQFLFHPALLDACLHAAFIYIQKAGSDNLVYLPQRIDRFKLFRKPDNSVFVYSQIKSSDWEDFVLDVLVIDQNDFSIIASIQNISCKAITETKEATTEKAYDGCFEYQWLKKDHEQKDSSKYTSINKCLILYRSNILANEFEKKLHTYGIQTFLEPLSASPSSTLSDSKLISIFNKYQVDENTSILFITDKSTLDSMDEWLSNTQNMPFNPFSLLLISKALLKLEKKPDFKIITFGCAAIPNIDESVNINDSLLFGMMRVIRNECPQVTSKIIDIAYGFSEIDINFAVDEILLTQRDGNCLEVAFRENSRYIRKLTPVNSEDADASAIVELDGYGGNYRMELSNKGVIESCKFRQFKYASPSENEVVIDVQAAALNFKDIANITGLFPTEAIKEDFVSDRFGFEISGKIASCGRNVQRFKPNDDVIAKVSDGFAGRVVINEDYVVHKPPRLTPQQSACIPMAFMTAYYALNYLVKLDKNETILIHSAASGVGLSAIQLAKIAGARIIATASTKEKRDYLRTLGIKDVFSSRSLDFYNKVMKATDNRGVDVVINSLSGQYLTQSLKCLAPFGRFLELGKLDIYNNAKLSMRHFNRNISYSSVDIERIAIQKPDLYRKMLCELVEMFDKEILTPIEIKDYPINKLTDALNELSLDEHIGKIVVSMVDNKVNVLPSLKTQLNTEGCYIITGGASGFGLEIAKWMAQRGAKSLVLISRSGCKSNYDEKCINDLRLDGVDILLENLDITNEEQLDKLFQKFGSKLPALLGIIHGAAVLDDASITNMDEKQFMRVFIPKALGAWNLHNMSVRYNIDLDFFVMLSSISSILGLYGQINYASANFFLDNLSALRNIKGYKGTSINLGVLGEYGGMSKSNENNEHIIQQLESHGMPPISLDKILTKIEIAINQSPAQRMAANFDWKRFIRVYSHLQNDMRFKECIDDAFGKGESLRTLGIKATLLSIDNDERSNLLVTKLAGALGDIIGIQEESINKDISLSKYSLDSMALNKYRNWILRNLDINYPIVKLIKGPTIRELTAELDSLLVLNEVIEPINNKEEVMN